MGVTVNPKDAVRGASHNWYHPAAAECVSHCRSCPVCVTAAAQLHGLTPCVHV